MPNIQVEESNWSIAQHYWHDLKKHLNSPDDRKKVQFLNRIIFESAGLNAFDYQSSNSTTVKAPERKDEIAPDIPPIEKLTDLLDEIDQENKFETTEVKVDDSQNVETKSDGKMTESWPV